MAQTVIGIFDHVAQAENAVERLTNAGFDRGLIDVSFNKTGVSEEANVAGEDLSDEDSFGQKISLFFRSIFENEGERDKFTAVASQSEAVITVQTENEQDAHHVVRILDECGAVDVDDRAGSNGDKADKPGGTSSGTTSEQPGSPMRRRSNQAGEDSVLRFTRSRIIARPIDEFLRLREERVKISPNPLDQEVTEGLYSFVNTFRRSKPV